MDLYTYLSEREKERERRGKEREREREIVRRSNKGEPPATSDEPQDLEEEKRVGADVRVCGVGGDFRSSNRGKAT